MSELLWGIVGFAAPFALGWLFSKINPTAFATMLSKLLARVLKDKEVRNKVENQIGKLLVDLGNAIINATPDDQKN
ncbi:MAG: hypothetical protein QXR93_06025 [Archaeoglobaceae archaeon]